MKKIISRFSIIFLASLFMTGCLTTEFKEYRFHINADGSGSGTVKFINLVSEEDEETETVTSDFDELINNYIEGENFEVDNPFYQVSSKELFEEDGMLCGKVEFTFDNYRDIGFYKFKDSDIAPVIYYLNDDSEVLIETDGEFYADNQNIPISLWEPGTNDFYFKTSIKEDMSDAQSLIEHYRLWKMIQE